MALALDASSNTAHVASNVTSQTTAAFSPPANSVIFVAVAMIAPVIDSITSVTNTGTALTWSLLRRGSGSGYGMAEVWWAANPSAQTNITVTANFASASFTLSGGCGIMRTLVFTGAASTQNGASVGATGTAAPSQTVVTTATNSWVFAAVNNSASTYTDPGTGQTTDASFVNGGDSWFTQRQNATTPASGTSVTMNCPNSSGRWDMVSFEVLALPATISGTANVIGGPVTTTATGRAAWTGTSAPVLGPIIVTSGGVVSGCARRAYLMLGSSTLLLEDFTAGYMCQSLDLGWPVVREVKNNRPDQDGIIDRTQYMGERVVTAHIIAIASAGARIDQVAQSFARFMAPSARPVLVYRLDTPQAVERQLTLRGAGYSWAVAGPSQRDIQLQWIAADPVARDPASKTVSATPSASGLINTPGEVPIRPLFRIIGPITAAVVTLSPPVFPPWKLAFVSGFAVAAGHYIDIDTNARTVYLDGDHSQPRLSSIDWTQSSWQWIPPGVDTTMTLSGSGTSLTTAVYATWQDGYLT
jgi:hypothetical protein